MAKILITGGSGLLGRAISELLLKDGHEPRWLSRKEGFDGPIKQFKWDINAYTLDEKAFEGVEYVIHLAGSGIVDKRWTVAYKKEILESRVKSGDLLQDYIFKNNFPLKSFVGGSAIGYYGSEPGARIFREDDLAGTDFLAETCQSWEKSYSHLPASGIRTTIVRTGIVLSTKGGAYAKMVLPFKLGLGASIGSGLQAFPWIHIHDVARIFIHCMFNENTKGIYNAVASDRTNNYTFSKQLAKSLHRPFFLPGVPTPLLTLVLGERAITLTGGAFVSNDKLKSSGFTFQFDTLNSALEDLAKS